MINEFRYKHFVSQPLAYLSSDRMVVYSKFISDTLFFHLVSDFKGVVSLPISQYVKTSKVKCSNNSNLFAAPIRAYL